MTTSIRIPLGVIALVSALALPGCDNGESGQKELKCDANGCLVCEQFTCREYQCQTSYQCPEGYGCSATSQCLPTSESVSGGGGGGGGGADGSDQTPVNDGAAQCATVQCPAGRVCEFGECVKEAEAEAPSTECTLSSQCKEGLSCVDGACVDRPAPIAEPGSCQDDGDCAAGLSCQASKCVAKGLPIRPEGTCQFELDCGKNGTCVNAKCYFPPSAGKCPAGAIVSEGLCLPRTASANECQLSADCPASSICVNATCRRTCAADNECTTGNLCGKDGLCRLDDRPVLQCIVTADCSSEFQGASAPACVDGRCLAACDTAAELGCAVEADRCTYGFCMPTAACFLKADCAGTFDCVNGRCGSLDGTPAPEPEVVPEEPVPEEPPAE